MERGGISKVYQLYRKDTKLGGKKKWSTSGGLSHALPESKGTFEESKLAWTNTSAQRATKEDLLEN